MEKHLTIEKNSFTSGWICGITDGEGCFSISFNYKISMPCGIEVRPSFSISQKAHSLDAIKKVNNFFDCGGIRYSRQDGTYKFEVRSTKDLNNKIIPFFNKNNLLTKKHVDFLLFSKICKLIATGQHLNKTGLKEILIESYKMNGSGKRKYKLEDLLKFIGELKV